MAFTVNNIEVRFEPEESTYKQAFSALAYDLDALQEQLARMLKKSRKRGGKTWTRAYEAAESTDRIMRGKVDALLGIGVCTALYGNTQLTAAGQGVPLWFSLLDALYSAMDAQLRPKDCEAVIVKYRTKRIARTRQ